MKDRNGNNSTGNSLRQRAEELLEEKELQELTPAEQADVQSLIHELRVHQFELEIQNEELQRAIKEAGELQKKYVELYEAAPVGYLTLDRQGKVLEVNRTGAEMLEREQGAIIKRRLGVFVETSDLEVFNEFLARAFDTKTKKSCEIRLNKKDRGIIYVHMEGIVAESAGREECRVIVVDITEKKKNEQALKESEASLETSNRQLESFNYTIAHDLRTPLRSINGFSSALLDDYSSVIDEKGQDYLRRIHSATVRMTALLEALLDLSRVTNKELTYELVDLSEVALQIITALRNSQPERKIRFVCQKGILAIGDPVLLRIVLDNLLGNAWKYSEKQPQVVIEFGVINDGERITYFVKDNGIGFDMAYANKLYRPFHRLHSIDEYSGTGIGLTTVYRIINRHGGTIHAESKPGEGATFYFTLPQQKNNITIKGTGSPADKREQVSQNKKRDK